MTEPSTSSSAIDDFYDYECPATQDDKEFLRALHFFQERNTEFNIFKKYINIIIKDLFVKFNTPWKDCFLALPLPILPSEIEFPSFRQRVSKQIGFKSRYEKFQRKNINIRLMHQFEHCTFSTRGTRNSTYSKNI